ncbi:MAG: preprotein translocase subunit SecA [Erysipelotrichales bacterium]|nr:preprotein translocase subunit SecA [Erysipelotrichales bacterium]
MATIFDQLLQVDKKLLKKVEAKARLVDALKDQVRALSDEELKHKTVEFRERLANGATEDDIMVEAFAVAREACYRVRGEFPFFVQLMGAVVLHEGDIAEMKTGEGKTLTSVLPAYLNALSGKGVHIVTVNEYLVSVGAELMGAVHKFLGLTVGVNMRALSAKQKRAVYECDIMYTTNSEVGFDYLRDNMVTSVEERVMRPLNYAIVDEVDSILIDESRTPLIISGGQMQTANLYRAADQFAKAIKEGEDFEIDIKTKTISLTEQGVAKAEKGFKVNNLYDLANTQLVHHINQALKANYIMAKDVEYVVQDNEIIIVDQFTGRLMKGRAYSDGLHQALEAKEGVTIKQETSTLATITYQNYFRLYNKLAGMTGTAKTEEEEFQSIYNMRVFEIPTNMPVARIDYPDAVYGTKAAKYKALVNEVLECHRKGQPVLVGTIAVETSELLSKMLTAVKVRHEVLNAKNHAREAEIIAKAGQKNAVTIATNMAGRGTDIKLGEGVVELGGLAVLGSERHESRRIDNQLRGRSGRQGDVGYSRFYVSLQDEIMIRFGSEKIQGIFDQLGDQAIESKMVTKSIASAQKRVEGNHFDMRKTLLDYDDVLRQQREVIYKQRNYILEHPEAHTLVKDMFDRVIGGYVARCTDYTPKTPVVDIEELNKSLSLLNLPENVLDPAAYTDMDVKDVEEKVVKAIWDLYEAKIEPYREKYLPFEKVVVLKLLDRNWIDHIDMMSKLREGIHLRGYATGSPLQAYISEGFKMFEDMMANISAEVVNYCMKLRFVEKYKDEEN